MKKLFVFIIILFNTSLAFTQIKNTIDSAQVFLRYPTIPLFKITTIPDSSFFTRDNLKKKKATIIMLFNPDCEHCQAETMKLKENIDLFKKAQIIMVSPISYKFIKKFYDEYEIAKFPTITMGQDPIYFFGSFYNIHSFPSIFVYNKKGKLITWFSGSVAIETVAAALKLPSPY